MMDTVYAPLRNLADIEAIERVPLEERITRWDFALNLIDGCRIDPSRPALLATRLGEVDGELHSWTFAELELRAVQVANFLRAQGIGPHDAVAVVSPTVPGLFAAMIGTMLAARPFPINWMLEAASLRDLMRECQVKAVIALGPTEGFSIWERVQEAVAQWPQSLPVYTLHDPFAEPHPNDLLSSAQGQLGVLNFDRPVAQRHDVACYVHSGGTTGHPKIVRILHGGMVFRQWAANQGLAFRPSDVVLSDTPLFHIGGLLVRGLVSTADGHTTIIPSMHGARDKRYIANYWRYIEKFGVTQISGVPTTLAVLAKNPPRNENIASLRPYFATGSTAIAPSVQDRIEQITGARTLQSYGMTENTSHATLDPRDGPIRPGCSGFRVPYVRIRVCELGPQGRILRDCGPNEVGMIVLGGPGIAGGYLDPAQNAGVFLDDGWLITGDLGSLDTEGYIRISGRQKDLIIRGGHNIEPRIIEEALLHAPAVALVAAVGKPDAHAGELPVAYVQLHPGAQASPESLLQVAAAYIPERAAVPKEIIVLDQLPLTAVGKPQKHLLQIDAARREFKTALASVQGDYAMEVSFVDGGLLLEVRVPTNETHCRAKIEGILSQYTVRHQVTLT